MSYKYVWRVLSKPWLWAAVALLVVLFVVSAGAQQGPTELGTVTCPENFTSCKANDVATTVSGCRACRRRECTDPTDTITIDLTVGYKAQADQRYDLGLFIAKTGQVNLGTRCVGAVAPIGGGDNPYFQDLDPLGHSLTDPSPDTCGDVDASADRPLDSEGDT